MFIANIFLFNSRILNFNPWLLSSNTAIRIIEANKDSNNNKRTNWLNKDKCSHYLIDSKMFWNRISAVSCWDWTWALVVRFQRINHSYSAKTILCKNNVSRRRRRLIDQDVRRVVDAVLDHSVHNYNLTWMLELWCATVDQLNQCKILKLELASWLLGYHSHIASGSKLFYISLSMFSLEGD